MKQIPNDQNSAENLEVLGAQRYAYSQAKQMLALQVAACLVEPLIDVVPGTPGAWAALVGLLIKRLDVLFLDPRQVRLRSIGAKMQELFDCEVLLLPWNSMQAGSRPDPEEISEAGRRYLEARGSRFLRDWYPSCVETTPAHVARAICQRSNVVWDTRLRSKYRFVIGWIVAIVSVGVFATAVARGLTVESFVLHVLAPLSPLLLWCIREWQRQTRAIEALGQLNAETNRYVENVVAGTMPQSESDAVARLIQNEIYHRRRLNPLVFDWIYTLMRRSFEGQMDVAAEVFVKRYNDSRRT